uniref:WGS project CAEQ00000000 data, annotated contig 309 n=1 Tax=Trypanosoma congolense (strain IL3000) TaxID=1068625 RepID=F9WES6_TRYCI|nr:unnamed protein product [Trypanosoma congolense IL3000]
MIMRAAVDVVKITLAVQGGHMHEEARLGSKIRTPPPLLRVMLHTLNLVRHLTTPPRHPCGPIDLAQNKRAPHRPPQLIGAEPPRRKQLRHPLKHIRIDKTTAHWGKRQLARCISKHYLIIPKLSASACSSSSIYIYVHIKHFVLLAINTWSMLDLKPSYY